MNSAVLSIDSDLAEVAQQRGQLFNRSASAQIEHWAQLGRVIEDTPDFSMRQLAKAIYAIDTSVFPEDPHRRVAAMEAAVEVVGMRIAEFSSQLYRERRSQRRDESRIDALLKQISVLRELQEDLNPEDTERVNAILAGNIPGHG